MVNLLFIQNYCFAPPFTSFYAVKLLSQLIKNICSTVQQQGPEAEKEDVVHQTEITFS